MKYEAKGIFRKRGIAQQFTKILSAENEKMATEKIYAELGSSQRLKRHDITIETIQVTK